MKRERASGFDLATVEREQRRFDEAHRVEVERLAAERVASADVPPEIAKLMPRVSNANDAPYM